MFCLSLIWLATPAFGALEYIRVEGSLTNHGAETFGGYSDQFVYFDVAVDTDIILYNESDYYVVYFASWIAGTYSGNVTEAASSEDASSNIYRYFAFEFDGFAPYERFYLGEKLPCYYDYMEPDCQAGLDFNWAVGDQLELLETVDFGDGLYTPFAFMEVSYRGSTPPPPIPLPASIWLLLSALLGIWKFRK